MFYRSLREFLSCVLPAKVAHWAPSMQFAKLLSQLAAVREQPPQGLSWLHGEVQPQAELFGKGYFALDRACRAEATWAGVQAT